MNQLENTYGKSIDNPIKINGIPESIEFLNSLVTDDFKPFLYHRLGSTFFGDSKPIDYYEIMKSGEIREILFIDTYSKITVLEIPAGYLCNSPKIIPTVIMGFGIIKTKGENYRLRKFPEDLF